MIKLWKNSLIAADNGKNGYLHKILLYYTDAKLENNKKEELIK